MIRTIAAVVVGLALATIGGCTEDDDLYCDAVTPCAVGMVCDYGKRECVPSSSGKADRGVGDSGADGPMADALGTDAVTADAGTM